MTATLWSPSRVDLALALLLSLAPSAVGQQFLDVGPSSGIDNVTFGRAVATVDLDGDGLLDAVCANDSAEDLFLHQLSDHTFERANEDWGVAPLVFASWSLVAADLDGDRDPDLFVGQGGFTASDPDRLLRNDLPDGTLVDVAAGDALTARQTFGSSALDYDRDGDVDLFAADLHLDHKLLRNDGDFAFTDVAAAAGLLIGSGTLLRPGRHSGAGDYDNDGWPDLGVGIFEGANQLFRNKGDGTFEDVAVAAGIDSPDENFGFTFDDLDNDGWLDVLLPKYDLDGGNMTRLMLNNGDGTFRDVSSDAGMGSQTDMGHNCGDLNGDGFPDVWLGTGHPTFADDDVLILLEPDGNGGLTGTPAAASLGFHASGPTRNHGSAFWDYDQDGDVDLYLNNGGMTAEAGTEQQDFLFQNQGDGSHWLAVLLHAEQDNTSAIGARLVLRTGSGREIHRHVSAGKGFGNTDSPFQHFGLGAETDLASLTIHWPSGREQTITGLTADTYVSVIEGERLRALRPVAPGTPGGPPDGGGTNPGAGGDLN